MFRVAVVTLGILAVIFTGLFINYFAELYRYKQCMNQPISELSVECQQVMQWNFTSIKLIVRLR
jgi:hypothetical protein